MCQTESEDETKTSYAMMRQTIDDMTDLLPIHQTDLNSSLFEIRSEMK